MFLESFSWTRSSVAQKTQCLLQAGKYPLKRNPVCWFKGNVHRSTGSGADQEIQKQPLTLNKILI